MTVRDLIEQLEEMNLDAEVRFASQPNYPLEYRIREEIIQTPDESKVYLAQSEQIGYLNSEVTELLDWNF